MGHHVLVLSAAGKWLKHSTAGPLPNRSTVGTSSAAQQAQRTESRGARSAVCSTARSSVLLMCSPAAEGERYW